MAQAYECDECGKLIKTPARVVGERTFKREGEYLPTKINAELRIYIKGEKPDLCRSCAEKVLKEVTVQGDD